MVFLGLSALYGLFLTLLNLRTALWIRERFPLAKVIARSSKGSRFATDTEIAEEHDIINVSISELLEEYIPGDWVGFG